MKSFTPSKIWPAAVGTVLLVVAGCGRDSVKVYHVDTNDVTIAAPAPAPAAAPAAMPATMPNGLPVPDNSGLPSLQYTQPASWEKKALTQMRVASFGVMQDGKQADISVIPLGGMAGTDLANVNRWRGQIGLAALPETEVAPLAEKITVGDQPADLYDLTGTAPGSGDAERIIGVIFHREDTSWFFKMTGDANLVEAQKPAFISFLKSVSFGAPSAAPSAMEMNQLPPSHPPIGGMDMGGVATPAPDATAKPTWSVPAGWQEGQLAQFLVAKYVITGEGGAQAAVNVSSLAGDGGGLLPNINRWRKQLGLDPVTDADVANLPTLDASGVKATLIELSGTDGRTGKPAKLVGMVLPLGGQTWFYKLMGDANVVTQQKDALIQFVRSAKYQAAQ
ncbi:MAG TPA: hypothetical protein VGF90_07030 [Verrucomicrobiae bacterium]